MECPNENRLEKKESIEYKKKKKTVEIRSQFRLRKIRVIIREINRSKVSLISTERESCSVDCKISRGTIRALR